MWGNQHTSSSRSPPPLQHPIPTHPHFIPEPPDTPVTGGAEPAGYMRFSSESSRPDFTHQQQQQHQPPKVRAAAQGTLPAATTYGAYPPPQPRTIPPNANAYPAPGFGGFVDTNNWGVNDATAQIGMQLGRNAMQVGTEYMEKNVRMLSSHDQKFTSPC